MATPTKQVMKIAQPAFAVALGSVGMNFLIQWILTNVTTLPGWLRKVVEIGGPFAAAGLVLAWKPALKDVATGVALPGVNSAVNTVFGAIGGKPAPPAVAGLGYTSAYEGYLGASANTYPLLPAPALNGVGAGMGGNLQGGGIEDFESSYL